MSPEQQPDNLANKEKSPKASEFAVSEIYVMPEKFRRQPAKSDKGKLILGISGAVFLSLLIAGAVVFFTMAEAPETTPPPASPSQQAAVSEEIAAEEKETPSPAATAESQEETPDTKEEVSEESAPAPAIPVPQIIPSSLDVDGDGLTNTEEFLYKTSRNRADSDEDGYVDGLEVLNLYNPAGTAPVRLMDSELVLLYQNESFGYQIFYPAEWLVRPIDASNREIIFRADSGEFIQVIVNENPEGLSARQWYLEQSQGLAPRQIESFSNDFFLGIISPDQLTLYLTLKETPKPQALYIITYNIGTRSEANFKTTFKMMAKSFAPLGVVEE